MVVSLPYRWSSLAVGPSPLASTGAYSPRDEADKEAQHSDVAEHPQEGAGELLVLHQLLQTRPGLDVVVLRDGRSPLMMGAPGRPWEMRGGG